MSIQRYIEELENINKEIKRNNLRNKTLRKRSGELEQNITDYLRVKEQHGLKYNGTAIILENKEKRPQKGKKQKETDVVSYLEKLGLSNPTDVYQNLQNIQKRSPVEHTKIKFKKL